MKPFPQRNGHRDRCLSFLHSLLAFVLALCAIVFCSGCASSDKPASASFASVVIPNRTVSQIQATTLAVFQDAGYQGLRKPDGTLEFEKEASRSAQLAYSSFGGGLTGERVNVRVRAEVVDLGAGSHRLQCNAWIVRQAGQQFFEEEQRRYNTSRGQYQKLLNEVAARLK